jgi:plastocyanin
MRKLVVTFALIAAAALTLAACGGSSSSSTPTASGGGGGGGAASSGGGGGGGASGGGGGGGATASGGSAVKISADPSGQLAYQQKSASAKAGKVTVDFTNQAPLAHNVTIADSSGKILGATNTITGSTASASVNLKPGTYTFYCSVDSHEQAGMKGTLKVQ